MCYSPCYDLLVLDLWSSFIIISSAVVSLVRRSKQCYYKVPKHRLTLDLRPASLTNTPVHQIPPLRSRAGTTSRTSLIYQPGVSEHHTPSSYRASIPLCLIHINKHLQPAIPAVPDHQQTPEPASQLCLALTTSTTPAAAMVHRHAGSQPVFVTGWDLRW